MRFFKIVNLFFLCNAMANDCNLPPENFDQVTSEEADKHINAMDTMAHKHSLLQHPFLTKFRDNNFEDMDRATRIFAQEHYVYSRHFINYLSAVADKITEEHIREPILENMAEENGNYSPEDLDVLRSHNISPQWIDKIPHKLLMQRFVNSTGLNANELMAQGITDSPGGRFTRFMLDLYANATACEGLAILGFAIEETVSTLYQFIWSGLQKTDQRPEDYVFFPLHIVVDDGHADLLKKSYKFYLTSDLFTTCTNSAKIVMDVLDRRTIFFNEMLDMIENRNSVTQDAAIDDAKKRISSIKYPEYTIQQKIAFASKILHSYGHTNSLAGQVSCIESTSPFAMHTIPYGYGFDEIRPEDVILVDGNLNIIGEEDERFPNYAIRFHKHIYEARDDVKCIIHTHPQWTNVLGLRSKAPFVEHMDVMGLYDDIAFAPTWPGVPFGDSEGEFMVNQLGDKNAAILSHHGLLALGQNIEEATYRAFFLEEGAKMQVRVMSTLKMGEYMNHVKKDLAIAAQKWRMSSGPVIAHFHYWVRQTLRL